jgi:glycerol-3-phosphate acyltransferase PlsY
LVAAVFTPFYAWLWLKSGVLVVAVVAVSLLLIWRHKSNIQNLLSGKEGAIGKTRPGDAPPP